MITLIIDGKEADVLQTENIIGEYAIAPIGDISKRVSARSIAFKLPKTSNNKSIFESAELTTSLSVKPYRRLRSRLYVDGVDMNMLFCELESVKDYYEVRLYGTNADFFNSIKDLKLSDLDLNDLNHHWQVSHVSDVTLPIQYPLKYGVVDFNSDSPNAAIDNVNARAYLGCMLPQVYYSEIIERIAANGGYTLNNETANTPFCQYAEMALVCGGDDYVRDFNYDRLKGVFGLTTIPTGSPSGLLFTCQSITSQLQSYWQRYFNSNTNFGGAFVIPDECEIEYKLSLNLYNIGGSSEVISVDVYSTSDTTGANLIRTYSINVPATGFPGTPFTFTDTNTVTCVIPDTGYSGFYFVVRSPSSTNVFNQIGDSVLEIISATQLTTGDGKPKDYDRRIVYETGTDAFVYNYVTVASNLPNISQAEAFKNYLLLTNSVCFTNEATKTITIVPFAEVINRITNRVDWSGKLDFIESTQTTFKLDYGQRSIFKYADDTDVVKPSGTDFILLIDNQNLEAEKIIIESIYSATESAERLGGREIAKINKFENLLPSITFSPRIILLKFEDGSFRYRELTNSDTGSLLITSEIPYGYFINNDELFNLGFENNLWDSFFLFLEGVLDRAKIIECRIRLNTSDIATFDFLTPVYIKELDGTFYVSKIKYDYTSNVSSIVELIKLL